MRMQEHGLTSPPIRPLILKEWNETRFLRWLKDEKSIDAVITSKPFIAEAKTAAPCFAQGLKIPGRKWGS